MRGFVSSRRTGSGRAHSALHFRHRIGEGYRGSGRMRARMEKSSSHIKVSIFNVKYPGTPVRVMDFRIRLVFWF
jgi:hypothetical protein